MKRAICLASIALLLYGCCGVSKGCDRCIPSQGSRLADAPSCAATGHAERPPGG